MIRWHWLPNAKSNWLAPLGWKDNREPKNKMLPSPATLTHCHILLVSYHKSRDSWQQVKRITESLRLEKNLKTIDSTHQYTFNPSACSALNHVLECHIHTFLEHFQGRWLTTALGSLVPGLGNPFNEQIFLNIQPKPPLVQQEAASSHLVAWCLGGDYPPGYTHLSGKWRLQ